MPSSIEKDGTAQAANAYIGPLTDPESKGFLGVYDKLARQKPNWVTLVEEEDGSAVFKLAVENDEALEIAKAWLATPNADEWMSDTGSPATWIRQARKGEAEWPESFVKKLNDLKTEGEQGVPPIIRRLRELHVLPLFFTPSFGSQSRTAPAVNSLPLSDLIWSGGPCLVNRSVKQARITGAGHRSIDPGRRIFRD